MILGSWKSAGIMVKAWTAGAALLACGGTAEASEIFGGVFAHDVDTMFTIGGYERGTSLQLGWRGHRIDALKVIGSPSPYVFGSANLSGGTNFAAAGLSWKFGRTLYIRPGIGLAVHDRPNDLVRDGERLDFGSRILFEPELGIGYQASDRLSIEASWVHMSNAQLLSRQNPGIDNIGMRVNWRF